MNTNLNLVNIPDVKSLIFCGDLHGNLSFLTYSIKNKNIRDSCIVLCGDVGLGFNCQNEEHFILNTIEQLCNDRNIYIVAVRGNHDDPNIWQSCKYKSRFMTPPDYSILNACNTNILLIGGGISIDRTSRSIMQSYWPNEGVPRNIDLIKHISDNMTIDIIASHISPHGAYPFVFNNIVNHYLATDELLEDDLWSEREYMKNVYNILSKTLKHWYYGHYHSSVKLMDNEMTFQLLNCGELDYYYDCRANYKAV